ncbi:hypothetical protein [Spirillospora sp. CA-128828]|uniref:hypothetical protein n=1 Tax=Spirillospora sp. CA-128828 TaxID=3240033 RepID=UPI003D8DA241
MTTLPAPTLSWFPLVPRPRPPGLPLATRIDQLRDLADQPGIGSLIEQLTQAAEICNKSALIASDCGLPDLARSLCWSQHQLFDHARPLPASAAKLALQPLLNIPRQLIREGDGDGAHAMLEALFHTARHRIDTVINGRTVSLRNLTCAPDDHKTVCTLVWAALLADGTRALAQAGRWKQAAERSAAHRGVGSRLLDGRQITILAQLQNGQVDEATTLVEQSTVPEPWERAVQSLLRVLCQRAAGAHAEADTEAMLTAVLTLMKQPDPATTVFRNRLGLAAVDLADACGTPRQSQLRHTLIDAAQHDAYAARDTLAHPLIHPVITAAQRRDLTDLIHASGLDTGTIPQPLLSDLAAAVSAAEHRLRTLLEGSQRDRPGITGAWVGAGPPSRSDSCTASRTSAGASRPADTPPDRT